MIILVTRRKGSSTIQIQDDLAFDVPMCREFQRRILDADRRLPQSALKPLHSITGMRI